MNRPVRTRMPWWCEGWGRKSPGYPIKKFDWKSDSVKCVDLTLLPYFDHISPKRHEIMDVSYLHQESLEPTSPCTDVHISPSHISK